MQSSADGDVVLAKLDDGEDLFASIDALAAEHRIVNGMVMWGIGMLRDFEIGYYTGTAYERETYADPMEVLALHGSYAAKADPRMHMHVAAAGRDHGVVGGHLFRGTVAVLNELCLRRLPRTKLSRVHNPLSGLKELTIARGEGPRPSVAAAGPPARGAKGSRRRTRG
jgi:predicted DNA-binding protein with PD1-like motif